MVDRWFGEGHAPKQADASIEIDEPLLADLTENGNGDYSGTGTLTFTFEGQGTVRKKGGTAKPGKDTK